VQQVTKGDFDVNLTVLPATVLSRGDMNHASEIFLLT
jgi:hypothetical protein